MTDLSARFVNLSVEAIMKETISFLLKKFGDVLNFITNKTFLFLSNEVKLVANYERDLVQINKKFEEIEALLEDAERRSLLEDSSQLNMWLRRIKDAAIDMENLLEDISMGPYPPEIAASMSKGISDHIMKLVLTVVSSSRPVMSMVCPSLSLTYPELEFRRHMGHTMKDVFESIDKVQTERCPPSTAPVILQPQTSSDIKSTVVGRDEEKNNIINFILNSEDVSASSSNANKNFRVIAIVGIGGLGKTTLAQLVYNAERIRTVQGSESFQQFLWVSVPVVFDVKAIFKTMFEKCERQGNTDNRTHSSESLQTHLRMKKVFIVMDDVWSEDWNAWDQFMAIIKDCKSGSVILVTTRSKVVSRCVKADYVIELEGLSSEDSWKLLCSKAIIDGEEIEGYSRFQNIGKEIFCGVPLAIDAVGEILRTSEESEYWDQVCGDQDIWQTTGRKVMCSLKLSLLRMSSKLKLKLKRCFTYCSFFPKRYKIYKNKLIYQWISMGYIASYVDGEILFESLLSMCFLQKSSEYGGEVYNLS